MRSLLRPVPWWAGAPIRMGLIGLIRLYRVTAGLLLGGQCRFYPSCSSYAEDAIRNAGWLRGIALAVWRVGRCNPFGAGGVDYPPQPRSAPAYDNVNIRTYDAVIHRGSGPAPRETRAEVEGWDEGVRRGRVRRQWAYP